MIGERGGGTHEQDLLRLGDLDGRHASDEGEGRELAVREGRAGGAEGAGEERGGGGSEGERAEVSGELGEDGRSRGHVVVDEEDEMGDC